MALYGGMAAGWLARCGLVMPAQRILITNGRTPAKLVALMTAAGPGDEIATEGSTCHTLKPLAHQLHLRLRGNLLKKLLPRQEWLHRKQGQHCQSLRHHGSLHR